MEPNEASTRLRALAKDDKMRPETARLRDIFDDVETALNAGVSQVNVLTELKTLGYTMTLASFKSALQRIRKERNKEGKTAPQARINSPATPDLLGVEPTGGTDTDQSEVAPSSELVRPAGITNAAWNEMQAKHAKRNRK